MGATEQAGAAALFFLFTAPLSPRVLYWPYQHRFHILPLKGMKERGRQASFFQEREVEAARTIKNLVSGPTLLQGSLEM